MYWESVSQGGGTPTLESFLDVENMEAILELMKVHTLHIHSAIAGGASEPLTEHVIKATHSLHHLNEWQLKYSPMATYINDVRYVVQYLASKDENHEELPMSHCLANMSARYR